jgi:uncharacterized protein
MATTFDTDERSTSGNRPTDLYTIVTTTKTYRLTTNLTDISLGGNTFTALTVSRGNNALQPDSGQNELIIYLPISHPLVQSYTATGIPEQNVQVTVQRLQSVSGQAQQVWTGFAQSLSVDGRTAMLRVPSVTADAFKTQLPVIGAHVLCNHRLFDVGCAPNPGGEYPTGAGSGTGGPLQSAFQVATTISSVSADGLTITLSSVGGQPDLWAQFGRLILSTGESRRIIVQIGNVITLTVPFPALTTNVTLEAGCPHNIQACQSKFNNFMNYGGHPYITAVVDPWHPNGLGIIQQV